MYATTPAHTTPADAQATVDAARRQGGTPALRTLLEGCTDTAQASLYLRHVTMPELRILADEMYVEDASDARRPALTRGILSALRGA